VTGDGKDQSVLLDRDGPLSIITLNRPQRRNGVDAAMCVMLFEAVREVSQSDARVLILRGAGDDFCVGADLKGESEGVGDVSLEALGAIYHASTLLYAMPQVTIATIDGGCAGAGLGWAAACDFRFASVQARFATAFLNVGVSGDMGLAWSLVRIVGAARARELLLFPEKLTGEQALAIGLVTRLFDRADLHTETLGLAEQLIGRQPMALRMHKANLLSAEALDFTQYIEVETARHLHTTGDPAFMAAAGAGALASKHR
jgi:2-(1,2-epoxy-1,2-dihydrophenyl)acetyl-CoA isomerase